MKNDPFAGLYSLADAARIWEKEDSTLRHAIHRGKFVNGIDVKLYGKQWIITEKAMLREYGPPKQNASE